MMAASFSHALLSNSNNPNLGLSSHWASFNRNFNHSPTRKHRNILIRASSQESDDCNDEECAPDKEVGKVSMEWLAGDKTRVTGTFPPKKRGWTGYVEKDTAGQTNIYPVEPAVYIAESAISSGTAGSSSDGAENTAALAAGIALISIAAASSIVLQVGKTSPPEIQTVEYSGPSLSYYISKFKPPPPPPPPPQIVEASEPPPTQVPQPQEEATISSSSSSNEVGQVQFDNASS